VSEKNSSYFNERSKNTSLRLKKKTKRCSHPPGTAIFSNPVQGYIVESKVDKDFNLH